MLYIVLTSVPLILYFSILRKINSRLNNVFFYFPVCSVGGKLVIENGSLEENDINDIRAEISFPSRWKSFLWICYVHSRNMFTFKSPIGCHESVTDTHVYLQVLLLFKSKHTHTHAHPHNDFLISFNNGILPLPQ